MQFESVDISLSANSLTKASINILTEDANLADIYLFQPSGNIVADTNGVRVTTANFDAKISNFLTMFAENGDLIVAPEYCCPWSLVPHINTGLSPKPGGLWSLGFQSITPRELESIAADNQNLKWIIEYPETGTHTFLNPLIYFFHAKDNEQQNQIVAFVQFKTIPMVDTELQLERNYLICGNKIYTFSNTQYGTHLASIICSDALNNFDPTTFFPQWSHLPFILLHPQMNPDPTHNIFREYRSRWAIKDGLKKQVICLNWARETQINNATSTATDFGRSCFLTKDNPQIGALDHIENHAKGLYYTYSSKRVHSFYMNFLEFTFHLRVPKAGRADTNAASANFACPKCIEIYSWQLNSWTPLLTGPDDNYQQSCAWANGDYNCLGTNSITQIEKEIVINWATGHLGGTIKEFYKNDSVMQNDSESIKRITFAQDSSRESSGYRNAVRTKFSILCMDILPDVNQYPVNVKHLHAQHELTHDNKKFNLTNGTDKALVCFIGEAEDGDINRCYADACKQLHQSEYRAICIWYRRHGNYSYKTTTDYNYTTAFENPVDITREE